MFDKVDDMNKKGTTRGWNYVRFLRSQSATTSTLPHGQAYPGISQLKEFVSRPLTPSLHGDCIRNENFKSFSTSDGHAPSFVGEKQTQLGGFET